MSENLPHPLLVALLLIIANIIWLQQRHRFNLVDGVGGRHPRRDMQIRFHILLQILNVLVSLVFFSTGL